MKTKAKLDLKQPHLWTHGTLISKEMDNETKQSSCSTINHGTILAGKNIGTAKCVVTNVLKNRQSERKIDPTVRSWGTPGPSTRVSCSESDDDEEEPWVPVKR